MAVTDARLTKMIIRTYSELIKLPTFEERFKYLELHGSVGKDTFGFDRYMNQQFYKHSREWKLVRNHIITRDLGCDLGVEGYEIPNGVTIFIHHMNPISVDDFKVDTPFLLEPEYLITTILNTHNAIHYGGQESLARRNFTERVRNDTCPWKR